MYQKIVFTRKDYDWTKPGEKEEDGEKEEGGKAILLAGKSSEAREEKVEEPDADEQEDIGAVRSEPDEVGELEETEEAVQEKQDLHFQSEFVLAVLDTKEIKSLCSQQEWLHGKKRTSSFKYFIGFCCCLGPVI